MPETPSPPDGQPKKRRAGKPSRPPAGKKVKKTFHLSPEADLRLAVHSHCMNMDRSELVESLILTHLRRFVVSDRGNGAGDDGGGEIAPERSPRGPRQRGLSHARTMMKTFAEIEVEEAIEHARQGGQALHLHRIIPDRDAAPRCFVEAVDRGEDIAHLFDLDADRLVTTAKYLGVKVIYIDRRGTDRQHIDLCGKPLKNALRMCGKPKPLALPLE